MQVPSFLVGSFDLGDLLTYVIPILALIVSFLSIYYSALRGPRIKIARVERINFVPEFDSKGAFAGYFEVPVVIINEGSKIGVLSDLYLLVIKPDEYYDKRIRTLDELKTLPCTVKDQESAVFRIRVRAIPLAPEIEYRISVIAWTAGKDIQSSFKFSLSREEWERLNSGAGLIQMLPQHS
jgi:hypothetical protein